MHSYPVVYAPNPSRRAWWIVGGIAGGVVAAGGAAIWWKARQRRYVGSGWEWPRTDRFPNVTSFGNALNILGYGAAVGLPGWEPLSTETMATVMVFQRDYNKVYEAAQLQGLTIGKPIVVDGLIGEDTVKGLIFALDANADPDDSWVAFVQDSKKMVRTAPAWQGGAPV